MKKLYITCLLAAGLFSCQGDTSKSGTSQNVDEALVQKFKNYTQTFIDGLWEFQPEWATRAGMHKYDSILSIPDQEGLSRTLTFAASHLDSLKQYDITRLSASYQIEHELIQNFLKSRQWAVRSLKAHGWNPASYNVSGLIAFMLNEQYAPLEERLSDIRKRLKSVPQYYEAARNNIHNPVPELAQLAINQNSGGLDVFKSTLKDSIQASKLTETEKSEFLRENDEAIASVTAYIDHLKSILPNSDASFRLGKELYEEKFKYDIQSSYSAEELYNLALERKDYLHQEMAAISQELWPKYFGSRTPPDDKLELIARVIDTLSYNHVKPEEFQDAIEAQIPELVAFVEEKDLLYIDPSKPLVVRKEPAYMAGVAGASISAPGPYDTDGNTYYNVGSLEGWSAKRAESYLREYNHYILQILNIHEAIPGHYTQLVYANNSPSLIKSVLRNGAMIEGWAVYTEQMMLENGYGNDEPEMWLMWYKWNLRTVCNTILDYAVHVKNMSKEEGIHLLTKEAFQEQAEADGKWNRVTVTSVQLTSYFAGYTEIIALREKLQKEKGENFNLKEFHEEFLSYGNAPVKSISRLMLE